MTGEPLPDTLDYKGEFGPELVIFLSFCCWLSKEGLLRQRRIRTYRGMRCFYEGLDCLEILEKDERRVFVPPQSRPAWLPIKNEHTFDGIGRPTRHLYPDLRKQFKAIPLSPEIEKPGRPLIIVHNKHNNEWGMGPVNHITLETLDIAFRVLKRDFTVIYVRHGIQARDPNLSDDHNAAQPFADRELLDRHPEVQCFDDLYAAYRAKGGSHDLNTFKNAVYSRCYRFISSQGGGAHQIALFPGSLLVVLHRQGQEENWAYASGYYSFMAAVPPIRAICRKDDDLIYSLGLFNGSTVVDDRIFLGSGADRLLAHLSPWTINQR